ncbi:MAG: DNA translocase FtsK 4TM domain-containing protein, partial [Terracidiphilus sp.]
MKPIPIVLSPTRSRALNVFLGLLLALVSILLLLALATYHAGDPSLNTATDAALPHAVHNWAGLFGAYLSDLLLQSLGVTAFLLPLWLGALGWGWMRSRAGGSAWLRWAGCALALVFMPAVFGLLPWHWRWLHAVPVEGVVGRLIAGLLVVYLNLQGAWLVAAVLAGAGIYFASAVSFWAIKQGIEDRWIHMISLNDRWRNWREERAERKADREAERAAQESPGPDQRLFSGAMGGATEARPEAQAKRPGRLASLFGRRERPFETDPVDEIPAYQRAAAQPAEAKVPVETSARRASIWERTVA